MSLFDTIDYSMLSEYQPIINRSKLLYMQYPHLLVKDNKILSTILLNTYKDINIDELTYGYFCAGENPAVFNLPPHFIVYGTAKYDHFAIPINGKTNIISLMPTNHKVVSELFVDITSQYVNLVCDILDIKEHMVRMILKIRSCFDSLSVSDVRERFNLSKDSAKFILETPLGELLDLRGFLNIEL